MLSDHKERLGVHVIEIEVSIRFKVRGGFRRLFVEELLW